MAERAGGLVVLRAIDRARRGGWLEGYRAALGDVERLAHSRGLPAEVGGLITDLRADAAAIEREHRAAPSEAKPEKIAADRIKAIAAARSRRESFASIAKRLGISKTQAQRLAGQPTPARAVRNRSVRTEKGPADADG